GFLEVLSGNLQNAFPRLDLTEYQAKLALLAKTIEINIQHIADKLKEPSKIIALENVKELRDEINTIIEGFNKQIQANNAIISAKKQKQAECTTKVWELIVFTLLNDITTYRKSRKVFDDEITALAKLITDGEKVSRALIREIADLNKRVVSTAPTIKSINDLLRDSGFQGFTLREKRGIPNAYEVVRYDGTVASNLSEGERNFIAFLYFYHLVRGAHADTEIGKDKIVVIDDPVSSMDSSVLFIVSTLVREMLEVCFNNTEYRENQREIQGDYIKQIFVLTGDPNSRIKCTLANWTGVAYRIPRTELEKCKGRGDLAQSGVYFLFGTSDDTGDSVVYIGQAGVRKNGEGILYRLQEHKRNPDKDYWTEAVVFTTSNNSFPSNIELSGLDVAMVNEVAREYKLKEYVDMQKGAYDYVLIDCMPSLGMMTVNALTAADSVVIPVQSHYLSLKGLEQLIGSITRARNKLNKELKIKGALLTLVDNRTNFAKDISAMLRQHYGKFLPIFDAEIPHSIRAAEAAAVGKSIFAHDPSGKVSVAYKDLVCRLFTEERRRHL
ncbi:AAA family ATPase, partial [Ruminococcaceae bacterium OttesenSCG-928-D13]|nr:AAA family ATPase [Ruminococcaceae bacterium OttesenSCG-928-D13]